MNKNNIKALTAGILVVLGLGSSVAARADMADFYVKADAGVVTSTLNKHQLDALVGDPTAATSLTSSDIGIALRAGYRLNTIVAVEGGYANLGQIEYSGHDGAQSGSITVRNQAALANVVLSAPLGTDLWVDGRIGAYHLGTHVNAKGTFLVNSSESASTNNLLAGLGLSYALTAHWTLHGDWTHFENAGPAARPYGVDHVNLDLFTLGTSYSF